MNSSDQKIGQLSPGLVDPFGRKVDYLRLSVTDRCNLRCIYCMAEEMTFLPKQQILTLEEMREGSCIVDAKLTSWMALKRQ